MVVDSQVQFSYDINFRYDELQTIFKNILRGESCTLVGVNGVGKTHLLRHFYRKDVHEKHLAALQSVEPHALDSSNLISPKTLVIIPLNLHEAPDFSIDAILRLILNKLREIVMNNDVYSALREPLTNALVDIEPQETMQQVITALNVIYQSLPAATGRIVLVLDPSDDLFLNTQSAIFRNFRALRDRFHYSLSFIVPMRQRPVQIMANVDDKRTMSPFIDLIIRNEVFIKPYGGDDYDIALDSLKERLLSATWTYSKQTETNLRRISGGHARLLRTLVDTDYLKIIEERSERVAVVDLLKDVNIRSQVEYLLDSLTPAEIDLLTQISNGRSYETQALDMNVANNLKSLHYKGLVVITEQGRRLTIPLLERYIRAINPR